MTMPYNPDDDENDDLTTQPAVPMPADPNDREALKAKLYAGLQQQLTGGDPTLAANRKDLGDETRRNALLVALNKSANQAGSIGGRVASSEPVEGAAQAVASAGQQDISAQAQAVANKQKVQEYLLGQIQKGDQFQSAQQMRKDAQTATLSQQQKLADNENQTKRDVANIQANSRTDVAQAGIDAGRYAAHAGGASGGGAIGDSKVQARLAKMNHDLNGGLASSKSDLGKNTAMVSSAKRVEALGEQGETQQGGLDARQIHELAIASAGLVSGGGTGAAQSTIEALVPHSSGDVTARIEEWLTSNPTGTGQQQFVSRMLETAHREKHLAQENIKGISNQVLSANSDLADNPQYMAAKKMALGTDSQFDDNGNYIPKPFMPPAPKAAAMPGGGGTAMAAPAWPRTVINPKTGHQATVSNAQELQEANAEGFQ